MRNAVLNWAFAYVVVIVALIVFIKLAEPQPKPVFYPQERITFDA